MKKLVLPARGRPHPRPGPCRAGERCRRHAAAAARGTVPGRPARPGRDRARPEHRLEAGAVRAAGHRRGLHREGRRVARRSTASTAPGSAMLWAGVPRTSPASPTRRTSSAGTGSIELMADKRIWMHFDMHQDQWHETYGGEGVPDWAVKRPLPFALAPYPKVPFPFGLLDPRGLHGLRPVLGQQGRAARRLGERLEAGRRALQEPALLDGLRPDQRALGRHRSGRPA